MKKSTQIIATIGSFKKAFYLFLAIAGLSFSAKAQFMCQASFTYTVGSAGMVSFTNTSTSSGTSPSYYWNFGNGATSNAQSPIYTYPYNGTYVATLTIIDSLNNCYSTFSDTIVISNTSNAPSCSASFVSSAGAGGLVSFTNTSSTTITNPVYSWDFGDASYSNAYSPSHTYQYNGSYYVVLQISDTLNNVLCTYTQWVTVTSASPCNLNASFGWTQGSNGLVSFTNTSGGISGSTVFNWSFGDGNYSGQVSPNHTYLYNGTYLVQLSIMDSSGVCASTFSDSVFITTGQNQPSCTAAFTYTLGAGGSVSFTDMSTGTLVNPNYYWDFGDGFGSSTQASPSYVYAFNGTYNVTFNVYDSTQFFGCTYTQAITITNTANAPCSDSAFFVLYPDSSQTATWNAYVIATNYNSLLNAVWSWGDGTTSTGIYPTHTYANAGWYTICMTAYWACGDTTTYCTTDSIYKAAGAMVTINVINTQNGINTNTQNMTALNAYPNPFTDDLTVNFTSYENKTITYTLFDMMGNQVAKENVSAHKGDNEFKINTDGISKGVYFINLSGNEGKKTSTIKVIK